MQGSSPPNPPARWRPFLICPNQVVHEELVAALTRLGHTPSLDVAAYPPPRALAEVVEARRPNIFFIEIGTDLRQGLALIAGAAALSPAPAVVAVHSSGDPDLILRAVRQGAAEFLFRPFQAGQIAAALERLARLTRQAGPSRAKVYCVLPAKSASGASTLACNLAYHLKRITSQRVLLADLDPLAGMVSFLFKLKSNYSFLDALQHASEMDADLWKGLITSYQGVDVLLSPENPVDAMSEKRDSGPLLEYSRDSYHTVVVDAAGPYGEWSLGLARACDELLLVTSNELAALHAARRALAHLCRSGLECDRIRLIAGRYNAGAGLSRDAVEKALETGVYEVLPNDPEAVHRALVEGRPVSPGTRLGKAFTCLAERLAGVPAPRNKGSLLTGLFSLFEVR